MPCHLNPHGRDLRTHSLPKTDTHTSHTMELPVSAYTLRYRQHALPADTGTGTGDPRDACTLSRAHGRTAQQHVQAQEHMQGYTHTDTGTVPPSAPSPPTGWP